MKRRIKKILSLIVACSIVTALFSFSAFAGNKFALGTYNGHAYEGYVSISSNTGYASLDYEISAPLKTMISVYCTSEGRKYYSNNSNHRTGTSVDVYWSPDAGETASRATGYYYINEINIKNCTAYV